MSRLPLILPFAVRQSDSDDVMFGVQATPSVALKRRLVAHTSRYSHPGGSHANSSTGQNLSTVRVSVRAAPRSLVVENVFDERKTMNRRSRSHTAHRPETTLERCGRRPGVSHRRRYPRLGLGPVSRASVLVAARSIPAPDRRLQRACCDGRHRLELLPGIGPADGRPAHCYRSSICRRSGGLNASARSPLVDYEPITRGPFPSSLIARPNASWWSSPTGAATRSSRLRARRRRHSRPGRAEEVHRTCSRE